MAMKEIPSIKTKNGQSAQLGKNTTWKLSLIDEKPIAYNDFKDSVV